MSKDVVIKVENVGKDFRLPHHRSDSLKQKITQVFKKKGKGYEVQHALNGVSFEIKKGEFFGILGRNGCGKSTLLKILAEIYRPTKGSVKVNGKLVPFIELGVGFNPQLTGRENVYLNGALLGFTKKEIDTRYDKIVEFAELHEFMDQQLKNYSSGMKVRLAFSVAIQADADILLLDEVLAVGDADFQRKCYDYFKFLKQQKKTIVFVTHSMSAAREYCDRAVLVEGGYIVSEGPVGKVTDDYLKLFNSDSKLSGDSKRWGSRQVYVDSIDIEVNNDKIVMSYILKSSKEITEDVIFGFRVKDRSGRVIAGANNLNVNGATILKFGKNESKKLVFSMPNIFGNATYGVSVTVGIDDGVTICDSWDDAATFMTSKDKVYYPIVCPADLVVK